MERRKRCTRLLLGAGLGALSVFSEPALAQDPPYQPPPIDRDEAQIAVLMEAMRAKPGSVEWSFVKLLPEEVFFPGDIPAFAANSDYDRVGRYPRDVQRVEQWYLSQIPDLYEELSLEADKPVQVLYLRGCSGSFSGDLEALMPGEAALPGDFGSRQWNIARLGTALEQAGLVTPDGDADIDMSALEDDMWNPTPETLRRVNRRLLALVAEPGEEGQTELKAPLPIVLLDYCGLPSRSAQLPGVLPEPGAAPPPAPQPSPPSERFYFVRPPAGMASVKLLRGVQAKACQIRKLPLQDARCESVSAAGNVPVRFVAPNTHHFVGKLGDQWVKGRYEVAYAQTREGAPLLPPGASPDQMGYPVIPLIPEGN